MKKAIIFAICFLALCNVLGYIQNDHVNGTVVGVSDGVVTFELENGNTYQWESESEFIIGEICNLTMFDCENFDVTDDIIVKVTRQN